MSDTVSLRRQVADIFTRLHLDVPSDDTDLFESGLFDSLIFVQLLGRLRQDLHVEPDLDDLAVEQFRSIRQIVELVAREQAREAARTRAAG